MKTELISKKTIGNKLYQEYLCPCGANTILEVKDLSSNHGKVNVTICCDECHKHYDVRYSSNHTTWDLYHDYTTYYEFPITKGVKAMNKNNVFYFKKIVDDVYPDENRPPVDIQAVVSSVKEKIKQLDDNDFIEVIISCFIPDLYSGMGKCEKLYTKLTELMVGEWWRRIGGDYHLPTKKSGTEDVELILGKGSIVCDAKVFRLGRSQKAPNVKDFLKLASVRLWINNLQKSKGQNVIGGLVTYSSLHEWESDSEVYEECTNLETPVVMLPYEVMALLLKYKDRYEIQNLLKLWNYADNKVKTSRNKKNYWAYITSFICKLISISDAEFRKEMKEYHHCILLSAKEYRSIVQESIDDVKNAIIADLDRFDDIEQLKEYVAEEIIKRDNSQALDYLKHIDSFRYYRDQH